MTLLTSITLDDRSEPLLLPWPSPGNPGGFLTFTAASDWRVFVGSLGINPRISEQAHKAATLSLRKHELVTRMSIVVIIGLDG